MKGKRSQKRPWAKGHRDLNLGALASVPRSEIGPDGRDYQVQHLRSSSKEYTCPACLHPIRVGTAHVVAWPEQQPFGLPEGLEARRHWHVECWRRGLRPL